VETLDSYLERLASADPSPGGGSAATIAAALAAALVAMVGRISARNPKYAEQKGLAAELVARADELRAELAHARQRDENAFEAVMAARALPRHDAAASAQRERALLAALDAAAAEPLHAAALALELLRLTMRSLEIPNRNLASDVGCAAEFAYAALVADAYNVRVNHRFMRDLDAIAAQERRLRELEDEGKGLLERLRSGVARRLARENDRS
jgi:formiminotetrahydrofolate cyclodeaminase